jgi:hypothetical protein
LEPHGGQLCGFRVFATRRSEQVRCSSREFDDDYFVLDGHKRVAAARAAGVEFVGADATQIYARPR